MQKPNDVEATFTQEEEELLDKYAFGEGMKRRKLGDHTPMDELMKKIKKRDASRIIFGGDRKKLEEKDEEE